MWGTVEHEEDREWSLASSMVQEIFHTTNIVYVYTLPDINRFKCIFVWPWTCAYFIHIISWGTEAYPPVDYHIPPGSRKSSAIQAGTQPQINSVMYDTQYVNTSHLRFIPSCYNIEFSELSVQFVSILVYGTLCPQDRDEWKVITHWRSVTQYHLHTEQVCNPRGSTLDFLP